jgi:4'-phosphopantetheinyl transferase
MTNDPNAPHPLHHSSRLDDRERADAQVAPGDPWLPSRQVPPLDEDTIQLWRLFVSSTTSPAFSSNNDAEVEGARLETLIAHEERVRRDRFRQADDRRRFGRARGLLRLLLGLHLQATPSGLTFALGSSGKPALAVPAHGAPPDGGGTASLRFNVSHSHEWIVIGVTRGREIGVDVEHENPRTELLDLARRFFSPREVAALTALPPAARDAAFYRIWACKEALVKASGEGLPMGLDRFSVIGAAEGRSTIDLRWEESPPPADEEAKGDEERPRDWAIRLLNIGSHYAAAVAVEGALPPRIDLFEWR